ncbi:MAG: hypothetical protein KC766_04390 [Myxococcales bacterium]|nr:hypothetical protein [Myxococcales bacterium]
MTDPTPGQFDPMPRGAPPASHDAIGFQNRATQQVINFQVAGDLSISTTLPKFIPHRMRVIGVLGYRATAGAGAGAGGTTTVQVYSKTDGAAAVALLDATMDFAQASGDTLRAVGSLNAADARWFDGGILVEAGDTLHVGITAIEAGATAPTGLTVGVLVQHA